MKGIGFELAVMMLLVLLLASSAVMKAIIRWVRQRAVPPQEARVSSRSSTARPRKPDETRRRAGPSSQLASPPTTATPPVPPARPSHAPRPAYAHRQPALRLLRAGVRSNPAGLRDTIALMAVLGPPLALEQGREETTGPPRKH